MGVRPFAVLRPKLCMRMHSRRYELIHPYLKEIDSGVLSEFAQLISFDRPRSRSVLPGVYVPPVVKLRSRS